MSTKELRSLSDKDLKAELDALYKEAFNLTMQKATKQLTKPHLIMQTRRKIARIKTILQERVMN